jgi:hypothetical protein
MTYEGQTGAVERVGAFSPGGAVPQPVNGAPPGSLPRRAPAAPRVRLRVRVPADVLVATMSGLTTLDESDPSVLSDEAIAAAPPIAPGFTVRRTSVARRGALD